MKTRRRLFLTVGIAGMVGLALPGTEGARASASTGATEVVAKLTGPDSLNRTDRWNVYGTDLGHMFRYGHQLRFTFGDTFGPDGRPETATDRRTNTMAWSTDITLGDGLKFDNYVTDPDRPHHAKELLPVDDQQVASVIPTYGIASGVPAINTLTNIAPAPLLGGIVSGVLGAERMFLHYMAVRQWLEPGDWDVAYSGFAYSDDEGRTWQKDPNVTWPEGSNFAQVAMLRHDSYVYLFGIPGGRFGGVKLARVPQGSLLEPGAYRYWDGSSWAEDEQSAITIVPAPVGELSVEWSNLHQKWLMTYLNDEVDAVVLRSAPSLTGPWSSELALATALEYPQLYAPYLVPDQNEKQNQGYIYFTMSRFDAYNVFLMRTYLPAL